MISAKFPEFNTDSVMLFLSSKTLLIFSIVFSKDASLKFLIKFLIFSKFDFSYVELLFILEERLREISF